MRLLNNSYEQSDLYEVKALFDIALINSCTHLSDNDACITIRNIYSFIYGAIESNSSEENVLNYRRRMFADIYNTRDLIYKKYNDKNVEFDSIDIISQDILVSFRQFCKLNNIDKVKYGKGNNLIEIDSESIKKAIAILKNKVLNLSMLLYHGETVYSLMLDTPAGKAGFANTIKGINGMYGEQYIKDAIASNYGAFKAMLVNEKGNKIGSSEKEYLDMQGLYGIVLGQYKSYAKQHPEILEIHRVRTAIDMKTSKGFVDRSTQETEDNKDKSLSDMSLTNLFERCRKLDNALFIPRHGNHPVYSIMEWYIKKKSTKLLEVFKKNLNEDVIDFMPYLSSFESNLVLGKENIEGKTGGDYYAKIKITNDILNYLYNEWYSQNISTADRLKINELCYICEHNYRHLASGDGINYTHTFPKITQGILDINRDKLNYSENYVSHYINLAYYNCLPDNDKSKYIVLTSSELELVNLFNDDFIKRRIDEKAQSPLSKHTNVVDSSLQYVLLPAGYERLKEIMTVFAELDELYEEVSKCGISLQELLPAYYNAEPCTLNGAVTYLMQSNREPITKSDNPLFTRAEMENLSRGKDSIFTFDWSLSKCRKASINISNNNQLYQANVMAGLCGLGTEHYPKYLEATLFTILRFALPISISEECKSYSFSDTLYKEFGNVGEYDKINEMLCINKEKPIKVGSLELDEDDLLKMTQLIDDNIEDIINIHSTDKYGFDIRREFFSECTVDRIYVIASLASLLFTEFYSYYTKNDYVNTMSYKYNRQNTKKFWTHKVPNKSNVYARSFTDYMSTGDNMVRYIPGRVEDVISRIPTAIKTAISTTFEGEFRELRSLFNSEITSEKMWHRIIQVLSNQLTESNNATAITSLMEEDYVGIKQRLYSAKKSIKDFNLDNGISKFIFTSVDTILIDGIKYDVKIIDNMMTATVKPKYAKYTCVQSCSVTLNGEPNSVNGYREGIKGIKGWEIWDSLEAMRYSTVLTLNSININDKYKSFICECADNSAINYISRMWEPIVSRLAKLVYFAKLYNDHTHPLVDKYAGKSITEFISDNRLRIKPLIINTTKTWTIIENMFTNDASENNILGRIIWDSNVRKYTITPPSMSNDTLYHTYAIGNSSRVSYTNPDIPPCELFDHKIETITCNNGNNKDVHNYFWNMDNKGYPKSLDYISTWSISKLIIECFSGIHQVAYAYDNISSVRVPMSKDYKMFLYRSTIDSLYKDDSIGMNQQTALQELDSESASQLATTSRSSIYNTVNNQDIKYKILAWKSNSDISNEYWSVKSDELYRYQYGNINFFFSPGYTLAEQYKFGLYNGSVDRALGPISSLLESYRGIVNEVRETQLYPVKGHNNNTISSETSLTVYNVYKESIIQYVVENSDLLCANYVGTLDIGHSLYNQDFYKRKQYILDEETGIIKYLNGQPVMRENGVNGRYKGFLHDFNCWIVIDTIKGRVKNSYPFGETQWQ